MLPHIKHSQLYPNQPGLVSRSSSKSLILRSLSAFTGFPSKYLSRSRRTGKALESNLSSSVASLEKGWCFATSQVLWMKKLSLCFQMKERQIFIAVRPDGVGGVVLHPVHPLPGLNHSLISPYLLFHPDPNLNFSPTLPYLTHLSSPYFQFHPVANFTLAITSPQPLFHPISNFT